MGVVGIDLGTTNTVVACVRNGRVHVIADAQGRRLLPSVVSFHPNGQVLVGADAKARIGIDGKNTISSVKRLLGRSWHSEELSKARSRFPFEMREGPGQGPLVLARGKEYTLPEISAFVLKRAKQIAEAALGEVVDKAVITVPAHFNELQRASTKVAGRVAGLEVLRILNEPTAAALAYGLGRQTNERIAVYDFGGGTFDCTLLNLSGNVFEVLASAGDTFLGGDDVDGAIAERIADAFLQQYRYDPRTDPQAFARLRLAGEEVKIDLSTADHTQVRLREVGYGIGGTHLDLTFGLTRAELEALVNPLVDRTFRVTQDALSLASLTPTAFDHVILVGGSTRMPIVRKRVESFFGMPPLDRVNPEEVVAIGAAIQAAALSDHLRRRSIPPPPEARRSSAQFEPGEEPVTSRQSFSDEIKTTPNDAIPTRVRVDANADEGGGDPTLSIHRGSPPPAASHPATTVPLSRTQPLPTQQTTQPIPTQPQATQPLPTLRPSGSPPANPYASQPPVAPGAPRAPRVPNEGFGPFGAIDEMPSIMSVSTISEVGQTPAPPRGTPPPVPPPPPSGRLSRPSVPGWDAGRSSPPPPMFPPQPGPSEPAPPRFAAQSAVPSPLPPSAAPVVHAPPGAPGVPPAPSLRPGAPAQSTVFPGSPSVRPGMNAPILVDVTPRALQVEVVGGFCDTVIPRNAKVPCERTRQFTTGSDNQVVVRVRVAQGEHAQFARNTYLGEVELSGLRKAARGEVQIGVTFELDADGSLRVRARDVATGKEAAASLQLVSIDTSESSVVVMIDRIAQHEMAP